MDYNYNIKNAIQNLIPWWQRQTKTLSYLYSLFVGLRTLVYTSTIQLNFEQENTSLYQFVLYVKKYLRFDSKTLTLEKYLNDEYTSIEGPNYEENNGIFIDNTAKSQIVLYNIDEPLDITYSYNLWQNYVTYKINDYLLYDNMIWKSLQNGNLNQQPGGGSPLYWEFYSSNIKFVYNKDEDSSGIYDFIVWVPSSVIYDENKMIAQINQYRTAPRTFKIQTY